MRGIYLILLVGCGSVKNNIEDAPPAVDTPIVDTPVDDPGCQPHVLLVGGTDIAPQGWGTVVQQPATLDLGPDFVHLTTTTTAAASVSGQQLLNYPGAFDPTKPFKLQVIMLVEQVNPHNSFDSAAAIMGSYAGGFGLGNDRSEMIYIDGASVGWADDTQTFNTTIANNVFHTFVLSVDANGAATVTVDGIMALSRNGFTTNGSIAIGDQTNDKDVDSALRIKSVTLLCP